MEEYFCPKCKEKLLELPPYEGKFPSWLVAPPLNYECPHGHGPFWKFEVLQEKDFRCFGEGYREVPGSAGQVREFVITVGLVSGYEGGEPVSTGKVGDAACEWMIKKARDKKPFLTGVLSPGEVLYSFPITSDSGESWTVGREPVVKFSGEVVPLYNSSLTDGEVIELLNDLAATLGEAAGQVRVYLRYLDKVWILQKKGSKTPQEDMTRASLSYEKE